MQVARFSESYVYVCMFDLCFCTIFLYYINKKEGCHDSEMRCVYVHLCAYVFFLKAAVHWAHIFFTAQLSSESSEKAWSVVSIKQGTQHAFSSTHIRAESKPEQRMSQEETKHQQFKHKDKHQTYVFQHTYTFPGANGPYQDTTRAGNNIPRIPRNAGRV
jgi:hypothetical protein